MKALNVDLLHRSVTAHVTADVAAGRVLGAALLVTQDEKPVFAKCFGTADLAKTRPVTPKTVFRLASMTKPITAAAALILIDRGQLRLEDPICRFLPQFESMKIAELSTDGVPRIVGTAKTPITVRQILSHSSGLGSGPLFTHFYRQMTEEQLKTLRASVEWYATLPLSFEPFTQCEYSGTAAFDVLARVIELVDGRPYGVFLQQEIFDPCRMVDTTFEPTEEQWARMIEMHDVRGERAVLGGTVKGCVFENYPPTHTAAGAGLISTLDDYARFTSMLLNRGCIDGVRILSEEAVRLMAAPQSPVAQKKDASYWGLGVRVITSESYRDLAVGTYGWSGAYGTHFWIDPVNRITAIYLKNSRFDGGSGNKTGKQLEIDVANALIK